MADDLWSKVKATVAGIAPILGNAILPGVGGVAGALVASALGTDNKPEAINSALLTATPEQYAALKKVEADNRERLAAIAADLDKAYLLDRQNARQREIEVTKATGIRDWDTVLLGWFITCAYVGVVLLLIFYSLPKMTPEIALMVGNLIGIIGSKMTTVFDYKFGSSKSSADKTNLLAQAQPISQQGDK
ncbi:MAG: hypothetical protein EPN22_16940 [Nitrospirae bacterium]|nr:MAG: hypothetical protein EPN22_16940 [Nitrospirota bacterium]